MFRAFGLVLGCRVFAAAPDLNPTPAVLEPCNLGKPEALPENAEG